MLRGDDPSAGDQPEAKAVFDLDPRSLLSTARRLRDSGELPTGRKVSGKFDFFLGSADNPIDPPPGWNPTGLQSKIDAGAQFVQTQFCMDAGVLRRYMARLAEQSMTAKLSFLIGVVPLRSAKSARWIKEKLFGAIIPDPLVDRMENARDPLAEGARICTDVIREMAGIPGVAGVHIMAPGNEAAVPDIIKTVQAGIGRFAPA